MSDHEGTRITPMAWLVMGLLVAMIIVEILGWTLLPMPWYLHTLLIGLICISTGVLIASWMLGSEFAEEEGTVMFVTCPHCGIKNPRTEERRYECYDCGKVFSELSGRYPVVPDSISGISSNSTSKRN